MFDVTLLPNDPELNLDDDAAVDAARLSLGSFSSIDLALIIGKANVHLGVVAIHQNDECLYLSDGLFLDPV